jgi:hypothetical protein
MRKNLVLLLVISLIAGCRPVGRISAIPTINALERNAYPGSGDLAGKFELDNPLNYDIQIEEDAKDVDYYAFRLIVSHPEEATFSFAWKQASATQEFPLNPESGPCLEGGQANEEALAFMQGESLDDTGLPDGPAVFSEEAAKRLSKSNGVLLWKTCEVLPALEPKDDKQNFQAQYTILVKTELVPGELHVFATVPGDLKSSALRLGFVPSPLHVAYIGDSVIWGQGINEESKMSTIVTQRLGEELEVPIRAHSFAHSGAGIGVTSGGSIPAARALCNRAHERDGEILTNNPSIFCQFNHLLDIGLVEGSDAPLPAERLDLLVMDGCINNIGGLTNITTGVGIANEEDDFLAAVETSCNRRLTTLLSYIRETAPNAKIVVTGYFPTLSNWSTFSCQAQLTYGAIALGTSVLTFGSCLVLVPPPGNFPACTTLAEGAFVGSEAIAQAGFAAWLANAAGRSTLWADSSNNEMANAVENAANHTAQLGFQGRNYDFTSETGSGWVEFAPISDAFLGHEAFVSNGDPFLWGLGCDFGPEDDVQEARRTACAGLPATTNDYEREICYRASAFHPNHAGEQVYIDRVLLTLRDRNFLPPAP